MTVEFAGFRAPDYILLLIAYPFLLAVTGVAWFATRVRPKGRRLSLRFRFLGLGFQIENGDANLTSNERQKSIGEINESTETD